MEEQQFKLFEENDWLPDVVMMEVQPLQERFEENVPLPDVDVNTPNKEEEAPKRQSLNSDKENINGTVTLCDSNVKRESLIHFENKDVREVTATIGEDQQRKTPSRPRNSLLSRFDPFYEPSPERTNEKELPLAFGDGDFTTIDDKLSLILELSLTSAVGDVKSIEEEISPILELSFASTVGDNTVEKEETSPLPTLAASDVTIIGTPVLDETFASDQLDSEVTEQSLIQEKTLIQEECIISNFDNHTQEITKKDVYPTSPVEKPVSGSVDNKTFVRELLDSVVDNTVNVIESLEAYKDCLFVSEKMDLNDKLVVLIEENADLKLQLNASQQLRATLELQLRQKEEIIIKSQTEVLRKEQALKQEIKELKEKCLENDNSQTKDLQDMVKTLSAREQKLVSEINVCKNKEKNYNKVMDGYEKTLKAQLQEFQKLNENHETVKHHLANLEVAFSDVHKKYERSKSVIDGYKTNEETLRQALMSLEDTIVKSEEKYETLKAHAKAQIEKSNQELQLIRDQYETEINKAIAITKRLEIKNASLTDSLEQKIKECTALAALCDEVTGKV